MSDLTIEQKLELLYRYQDIQGQVLNDLLNLTQGALPHLSYQIGEIIAAWNRAEESVRLRIQGNETGETK